MMKRRYLFNYIRMLKLSKTRFKSGYFQGLALLLIIGLSLYLMEYPSNDTWTSLEYSPEFGIGGSAPADLRQHFDIREMPPPFFQNPHEPENEVSPFFYHPDKTSESFRKAGTPFIKLTDGKITSPFGYRKSPFSDKDEFHRGIDIGAPPGTPVFAVMDGNVVFSAYEGDFGYVLAVDHGNGVTSRYAHIQKALKQPGDPVKSGDAIAVVGNSGKSTGPHLHYEVLVEGVPVNPDRFLISRP
ncbi:MAG: M23 family metallopeptidase [Thermodesulfobacteriota bacterium]